MGEGIQWILDDERQFEFQALQYQCPHEGIGIQAFDQIGFTIIIFEQLHGLVTRVRSNIVMNPVKAVPKLRESFRKFRQHGIASAAVTDDNQYAVGQGVLEDRVEVVTHTV